MVIPPRPAGHSTQQPQPQPQPQHVTNRRSGGTTSRSRRHVPHTSQHTPPPPLSSSTTTTAPGLVEVSTSSQSESLSTGTRTSVGSKSSRRNLPQQPTYASHPTTSSPPLPPTPLSGPSTAHRSNAYSHQQQQQQQPAMHHYRSSSPLPLHLDAESPQQQTPSSSWSQHQQPQPHTRSSLRQGPHHRANVPHTHGRTDTGSAVYHHHQQQQQQQQQQQPLHHHDSNRGQPHGRQSPSPLQQQQQQHQQQQQLYPNEERRIRRTHSPVQSEPNFSSGTKEEARLNFSAYVNRFAGYDPRSSTAPRQQQQQPQQQYHPPRVDPHGNDDSNDHDHDHERHDRDRDRDAFVSERMREIHRYDSERDLHLTHAPENDTIAYHSHQQQQQHAPASLRTTNHTNAIGIAQPTYEEEALEMSWDEHQRSTPVQNNYIGSVRRLYEEDTASQGGRSSGHSIHSRNQHQQQQQQPRGRQQERQQQSDPNPSHALPEWDGDENNGIPAAYYRADASMRQPANNSNNTNGRSFLAAAAAPVRFSNNASQQPHCAVTSQDHHSYQQQQQQQHHVNNAYYHPQDQSFQSTLSADSASRAGNDSMHWQQQQQQQKHSRHPPLDQNYTTTENHHNSSNGNDDENMVGMVQQLDISVETPDGHGQSVKDLKRRLWDEGEDLQVAVPPSLPGHGDAHYRHWLHYQGPELAGRQGVRVSRSLSPGRRQYSNRSHQAGRQHHIREQIDMSMSNSNSDTNNYRSTSSQDRMMPMQMRPPILQTRSGDAADAASSSAASTPSGILFKSRFYQAAIMASQSKSPAQASPQVRSLRQRGHHGQQQLASLVSQQQEETHMNLNHPNKGEDPPRRERWSDPIIRHRPPTGSREESQNIELSPSLSSHRQQSQDQNSNIHKKKISIASSTTTTPITTDNTTVASDVVALVAKLNAVTAVSRDNPEKALKQIDEILRNGSFESQQNDLTSHQRQRHGVSVRSKTRSSQKTLPAQESNEKEKETEKDEEGSSDDSEDTSVSGITDPTYMGDKPPTGSNIVHDVVPTPHMLSTSSFRRPRPSGLAAYSNPSYSIDKQGNKQVGKRSPQSSVKPSNHSQSLDDRNRVGASENNATHNDRQNPQLGAATIALKTREFDDQSHSDSCTSNNLLRLQRTLPSSPDASRATNHLSVNTEDLGSIVTTTPERMNSGLLERRRSHPWDDTRADTNPTLIPKENRAVRNTSMEDGVGIEVSLTGGDDVCNLSQGESCSVFELSEGGSTVSSHDVVHSSMKKVPEKRTPKDAYFNGGISAVDSSLIQNPSDGTPDLTNFPSSERYRMMTQSVSDDFDDAWVALPTNKFFPAKQLGVPRTEGRRSGMSEQPPSTLRARSRGGEPPQGRFPQHHVVNEMFDGDILTNTSSNLSHSVTEAFFDKNDLLPRTLPNGSGNSDISEAFNDVDISFGDETFDHMPMPKTAKAATGRDRRKKSLFGNHKKDGTSPTLVCMRDTDEEERKLADATSSAGCIRSRGTSKSRSPRRGKSPGRRWFGRKD